ncbi:hypothetical protein [Aneurinibacillus tyrosinisolvens]|uniref:hypothetical protein n=1 Tax=Aneurinibacillus tyrosinisolvens TaxID=1443435 RepID=UPI00063F1F2E|nr:hypothetical protein [Aneurinibacillus tyrosinisolvens]
MVECPECKKEMQVTEEDADFANYACRDDFDLNKCAMTAIVKEDNGKWVKTIYKKGEFYSEGETDAPF